MASKEAALRQTIDEQVGAIENLQKSNQRLKQELFAAVSRVIARMRQRADIAGTCFTK